MKREEKIQLEINEAYLEILELMKDLGEMEHKFTNSILFEYVMVEEGVVEETYIEGIELCPMFAENPETCILLIIKGEKTDSDNRKMIYNLPLRRIFILDDIIKRLKWDLEEKFHPTTPIEEIIFLTPEDIIITDPCYIIKPEVEEYKEDELSQILRKQSPLDSVTEDEITPELIYLSWKQELEEDRRIREEINKIPPKEPSDFEKTNGYTEFSPLGIHDAIAKNNGYGDWSCTVYDTDTNTPIGKFSADAGMVGVFSLQQVLKYNPDFDNHITKPHTTTLIKNFKGKVRFDKDEVGNVIVIGEGSTNFFTKQTGL